MWGGELLPRRRREFLSLRLSSRVSPSMRTLATAIGTIQPGSMSLTREHWRATRATIRLGFHERKARAGHRLPGKLFGGLALEKGRRGTTRSCEGASRPTGTRPTPIRAILSTPVPTHPHKLGATPLALISDTSPCFHCSRCVGRSGSLWARSTLSSGDRGSV